MKRDMLDLLDRRDLGLSLTHREKLRLVKGYLIATGVVVLFVLLLSLAGPQ